MKMNPNESAFPVEGDNLTFHSIGLTKREWIATTILGSIVSNYSNEFNAVKQAIEVADACIAELNKDKE